MGSVSAAMTTNSDTPRFSVFVAASTRGMAWHGVQGQPAGSEPAAHMHAELRAGTFVGAFLQLFVVGSLLNDVEDGVRELRTRRRASAMLRFRRGSRRGQQVAKLTANSRTWESASG